MTNKSTLQVLTEARALIAKPENWGWYVYDDGRRMCAAGAVCRANGVSRWHGGDAQIALQRVTGCYLGSFNDTHTHAEVLAVFDQAIAAERAKAQGSRLTDQVQGIINDALAVAAELPAADPVSSTL